MSQSEALTIESLPDRQAAYLAGKAAYAHGHYDEARRYLEQLAFVNVGDTLTASGYPPSLAANTLLARMEQKQGNHVAAIEHWLLVCLLQPEKIEAPLQLARLFRRRGDYRQAQKYYTIVESLEPNHTEPAQQRARLQRQIMHSEAAEPEYSMRHIAIAGTSYCGSTLLGCQFGELQGVGHIGESGWLVGYRHEGATADINFDENFHAAIPVCHSCGADCEMISREFRHELQCNPANWYYRIAEKLQCEVLVSADKTPFKLLDYDPELRFDMLVLFKSPMQSWYSNYRKIQHPQPGMNPQSNIEDWARKWIAVYRTYLHNFDNKGQKVYLYFDAYCDSPERHFDWLCRHFRLPLRSPANDKAYTPESQHYFGGNSLFNQSRKATTAGGQVVCPLNPVQLPQQDIDYIARHDELQSVYSELKERYGQNLAAILA